MATVYPTAAGAWSTRTWNNDATGAAYGTTPQPGDIVLANGLTITIDANITVTELRTVAGATAATGGSFTTSGTRVVTADVRAGTTTCLTFSSGSGSSLVGRSYGSTTGNSISGLLVGSGCQHIGDSFGGVGGINRFGTSLNAAGTQTGNCYAGTVGNTNHGTSAGFMSAIYGNSYGDTTGSLTNSAGSALSPGSVQYGDCFGGFSWGVFNSGGMFVGDVFGSSVAGQTAWAMTMSTSGISRGNATGGTVGGGIFSNQFGSMSLVENATRLGTPMAAQSQTTQNILIVRSGAANVSAGANTITTIAAAALYYPWVTNWWNPSSGKPSNPFFQQVIG